MFNPSPEMICFQWHITDLCHGKCTHCYGQNFVGPDKLDIDEIQKVLNKLAQDERKLFPDLTGGEPMFIKNFREILKAVEDNSGVFNFGIISSGIDLDPSFCKFLAGLKKLAHIKISLESPDPLINSAIRWPGALEIAVKAIKNLAEFDLPIVIMMTLSKANMREIEKMVQFAGQIGANGLIIEKFISLGQGEKIGPSPLSPSDWLSCLQSIGKIAEIDDISSLYPYKAFWIKFENKEIGDIDGAFCNLGLDSMALMPNGDIYPCRRLPIKVGNIFKESTGNILKKLCKWKGTDCRAEAMAMNKGKLREESP